MNELALFAGAGGGILGGKLLGWRTVCAVEHAPYPRSVLLARQRDGILPRFPIWDDVRTFDGKPWRGIVDVVSAGFPCQRHSNLGKLHGSEGFDGWPDTIRIARECGAKGLLLENVPAILSEYWGVVLRDLARFGFDAEWDVFSCPQISRQAPTIGGRVFAVASARGQRLEKNESFCAKSESRGKSTLPSSTACTVWNEGLPKPGISQLADGMAIAMDQVKAIGNGQVPAVVRLAWETLTP